MASGMCSSSHSSLSRTSIITASPLRDFDAASCGEISVMFFFASETSFSKRLCSDIDHDRLSRQCRVKLQARIKQNRSGRPTKHTNRRESFGSKYRHVDRVICLRSTAPDFIPSALGDWNFQPLMFSTGATSDTAQRRATASVVERWKLDVERWTFSYS